MAARESNLFIYRVEHWKIKFVSMHGHVISSIQRSNKIKTEIYDS